MATTFHDAMRRLGQEGSAGGLRLVRLVSLNQANRYNARLIEFAADGSTQEVAADLLTVTNLAEPANAAGSVPGGTEAFAMDVEGRWVVFVRQVPSAVFLAKVKASLGQSLYSVREQDCTGVRTLTDRSGVYDLPAINLAELSLGDGAAVDVGTFVLVRSITDAASPATLRYVFDHPVYAKYIG